MQSQAGVAHDARMTPQRAEQILAENFADWVRALNISIPQIGVEGATLSIPVTPAIARVGGIVSGQALATLADTAMVFACFGHLGKLEYVSTVTLDTQFLRPASGARIVAMAEVTRAGRSTIFAKVMLRTEPSGKEVAFATGTFARPAG